MKTYNDSEKRYICIDIGGTTIKSGILDENARILYQAETPTEAGKGGAAILDKIREIIGGYQKSGEAEGVCISASGIVDPIRGKIVHANENMPGWKGIELKEALETEFEIPCEVENDVNCAGLAEFYSGAARGCQNVLCITVGTGIGGCAIINGQLLRGASYAACEIGYMEINGMVFEKSASVSALTGKVAERKKEEKSEWNGKRILEYARKGDKICIEVLHEMTVSLGKGIAQICYVLNPEIVVLGGGIMQGESTIATEVERTVRASLFPAISPRLGLTVAWHHNTAGMIGAWYYFSAKHGKKSDTAF